MENYWTRLNRTRLGRRSVLRGIGITGAGAAAYAVAGCGDDDKPSGGGSPSSATTAPGSTSAPGASPTPQNFLASIPENPPDPTPVAQFKAGGTMTRIFDRGLAFESFAPGASNVAEVTGNVYSRMVRASNQAAMKSPYVPEFVPDLAASWEQPDATTIVFQLQPGIKWQNVAPLSGRAFTVDDVKYMIGRGQNHAKNSGKADWQRVASVEDVGGGKVRFKLTKPYAPMLNLMAAPGWGFVPPEIGGTDNATTATSAVGTGPFIVDKFTPNVEVVYKKNPDYFKKDSAGKQLPYMDGYTLSYVADPATRLALVEGGKVDSHYQQSTPVTFDNAEGIAKRNPGKFVFQRISQLAPFFYVAGHTTKAPFSDVRFRRAMNMLMDRATMVKSIYLGYGQNGPYFPWPAALDKPPTLEDLGPNYKFDVATAKQLLSAAGVAPGTEISLEWYATAAPPLESIVTLYEQTVAQAGIKLKLVRNTDVNAHFGRLIGRSWPDLTLTAYSTAFADAEAVPGGFVPGKGDNFIDLNDPDMNTLYEKLQTATGAERKAINKQMWDRHLDQMWLGGIPQPNDLTWWTTRVHNLRNTSAYGNLGYGNMDQVWLS